MVPLLHFADKVTGNESVIMNLKKSVCKYKVNSGTGIFIAAKTLPQCLFFCQDFASWALLRGYIKSGAPKYSSLDLV